MKDKPTISACMIVKNEEKLLPQCLESIKDIVGEIIIVDTGSTDRTIEIAESYGVKIFHHPWENDFSKHRNQSISYATGDWIFILDGDEELIQWDDHLENICCNKHIDGVYVKVENIYGEGRGEAWHNSVRMFRKDKKIRYEGKVHNRLTGVKNGSASSIVIYHRGYCLDSGKEEQKYLRTKTLLEREIERDPENAEYRHYLAVAYLGKDLYDQALQQCRKALRLASKNHQEKDLYLWTRFVGAVCCLNTNRVDEAKSLAQDAIRINPNHLDSHYILSSIYYSQGNMKSFMDHCDRYLSLIGDLKVTPGKFGTMVHNTVMHEWRIRLHRGFAFIDLGKGKEAREEHSLSLNKCHSKGEYYKQRCLIHLMRSEYESAERFLRKAFKYGFRDGELEKVKSELSKKRHERDGDNAKHVTVKNADNPTISLCMIVKNEEKFLPRCLDSIKDYVDEIVIVDTGSTDSTVEIAKSYGARIFFHPWEGDFSKHRNQSIKYATRDWIFILDADEMLLAGCGRIIREAVKNDSIDNIHVVVKSVFDRGSGEAVHNSIRIFRNNGIIHYEGRVHNRLVGGKASKIYPLTILHEGYNLPREESRKKFIRTATLLQKEVEENPHNPWGYHHLAACYLSQHMYKDAIDMAIKAVGLAEDNNDPDFLYLWSHFIAGLSYLKINEVNCAERICLKAIDKNGKHLDSHYLLTIIYFHRRKWDELFHHSNIYFSLLQRIQTDPGEFGPMVHNTANHKWRVHFHRGLAYKEMKREKKAEEEFSIARRLCKSKGEYCKLLSIYYLDLSDLFQAEKYLREALGHNPEDEELYRLGVRIYQILGLVEEEKNFLEETLKIDPDHLENTFRLGTIYLQQGRYGGAKKLLENVVQKDESHWGALINLGIAARRSGDPDSALKYLEKALEGSPGSVEALSNLGYVYYDKDDLPKAKQVFEQLINIDFALLDIHLMLCMIHIRLNSPERIVPECDKILSLLSLDRNITLNSLSDLGNLFIKIGKTLFEQKRPATAKLAFDVYVHLSGQSGGSLKRVGRICFEQEDYAAGLAYLEKAIWANPQDRESFRLMGDCYAKMGIDEAAAMSYQKAKELNTDGLSRNKTALNNDSTPSRY